MHPNKPPELWIDEVGVAPSHQRQGLGQRLLAELLRHGTALGCVQAWVLTSPMNEAAHALYRAEGGQAATELSVLYEFPLSPPGTRT
ncbi:MAG: GNAT family N-acetyltransferase [Gemmatimonadales bacterium]